MDINTFCILIAQDKDTHKILLSEISNDRQKMFWVSQKQLFNNLLSEEYIINKDQVSWIIFRPVNSNNSLHSKNIEHNKLTL
ncbi:hypothetical protein LNTAR_09024 [Lentisphaera araneosa HTCC2155]|uniref:Uncharacterized protein n=1 Tax=Lentisphaera araneosa HTCC2155 TaxID=313628 RepID=A6DI46_9BACT|nr:hypothetical protein [Lentisphaera araneosa]EDM28700.1 hypothetical protein LNTAR_09024 [Lentisphaera araneosa HTCC2155]